MKRFKKVLALALASAMAVGALAGCSGNAGTEGSASNTFKIGGIGPTTGDAAVYGESVMNGAQIAVDEINAAGGINGYQIEFKFEDDTTTPEVAINAYNTLKDWGMDVLLGTVTTGACLGVVEKTAADNMFQITPSASNKDVVAGDNVFQVCFTDPNQGVASAQYFADHNLGSKIAVIYNSSDEYSQGVYEAFKKKADELGLNIVEVQTFTKDTKSEFSAQVKACADAGADLVFLPFYYNEAALVLTEAANEGYSPIFFGVDGMDGILNVDGFDTSLAEGVYLLTPFAADASDDLTKSFVATYEEKYGSTPTQFAADGYDGVYIIKAAIEKAGLTPEASVSELCEAMKKAMTEISVDGLTGEGMVWEASGEVNKAPKAVVIKDGVYVSAE